MNKKMIEFNEATSGPTAFASPWSAPSKSKFQDLILKPEYAARRMKFPTGSTWVRILPALRNSDKGWLIGVHALNYAAGRHLHPKTMISGSKSVFDHAYAWLKTNRKSDLYSKENKMGYRLLADPICLFWILVEEEGKTVARLLLASGYDGIRGGVSGLGHQILELIKEVDEDGKPIGNPLDPQYGVQICVDKRQAPGARYPSYSLRMGRVPAPIDDMIEKMDPDEVSALAPLEEVLYQPSEDEEWALLENVIGAETTQMIRNSIQ